MKLCSHPPPTTTVPFTTSCPKENIRGYPRQCVGPPWTGLASVSGATWLEPLLSALVPARVMRPTWQSMGELMILSTSPKCSEPSSETTLKACKTQKPPSQQEGPPTSVWAFDLGTHGSIRHPTNVRDYPHISAEGKRRR